MSMKTSASGRALIEAREGRRLLAYRDTEGVLTIGVGHTGRMSPPPVTADMTIGEAQCDAMLAADLAPVEAVINGAVKVPVSQNEFDALASLGFNIGGGGLRASTVVKRLNLGDVAGAGEAFMMWVHPAVLTGRRRAEMAQFLTPDAPVAGGISRAQAVASARAATLATMAETAKAKAHTAQSGAAALIVASGTTAATVQTQHPSVALIAGALVLSAGLGTALVAVFAHRASRALAGNAARQALVAAGLGTASADLADTLAH